MNPSWMVSRVTWLHSWWVTHRAQPGGAGIGDRQETGERVGRSVTAVGDRGHNAVRRGPLAEPDRWATVGHGVGDRLADPQNQGIDACRGRLGYRWSRSPTIRRTAAPSATERCAQRWRARQRRNDLAGQQRAVPLGSSPTPAAHLEDAVQHPPGRPGASVVSQGDRPSPEACSSGGHGERRPVQRLGASRVAHRLPLNACRTRHLDGTPHRFWPRCPVSPAWHGRLRQPQNSPGTNPGSPVLNPVHQVYGQVGSPPDRPERMRAVMS